MHSSFEQQQTALYEQFLMSLQSLSLAFQASGTKLSPKVISEANDQFLEHSQSFRSWFFDGIRAEVGDIWETDVDESVYFRWVGRVEHQLMSDIVACLYANQTTFISSLRFGGSFGGLSDLLKGMHGSIGYLVQRKSQDMRWNVRTADGKTVSCLKMIFVDCKHLSYRLEIFKRLVSAYESGVKTVEIQHKLNDTSYKVSVKELLESDELCERYFHHNSQHFIFW